MSESFTTASIEFFRDFVKAAIDAIPDYRTPLSGRWKGTSWTAKPSAVENLQGEARDISLTIRTKSGVKVIAQGVAVKHDDNWILGWANIQIPSASDHSCWKIRGHLNNEGDFEFEEPRKLV